MASWRLKAAPRDEEIKSPAREKQDTGGVEGLDVEIESGPSYKVAMPVPSSGSASHSRGQPVFPGR